MSKGEITCHSCQSGEIIIIIIFCTLNDIKIYFLVLYLTQIPHRDREQWIQWLWWNRITYHQGLYIKAKYITLWEAICQNNAIIARLLKVKGKISKGISKECVTYKVIGISCVGWQFWMLPCRIGSLYENAAGMWSGRPTFWKITYYFFNSNVTVQ